VVVHACNSSAQEAETKDHKFKASWGYTVETLSQKPNPTQPNQTNKQTDRKRKIVFFCFLVKYEIFK
jgi:hypothetical protein